jgi:small-conductance mechanosensitive channel
MIPNDMPQKPKRKRKNEEQRRLLIGAVIAGALTVAVAVLTFVGTAQQSAAQPGTPTVVLGTPLLMTPTADAATDSP